MTSECGVDGCGRQRQAKGFCKKHYYRARQNGDPLVTRRGEDGPVQSWIAELLAASPIAECVAWPFARGADGYGRLTADKRTHVASRYICEAAHGEPPTRKHEARHLCGNGHLGCVNPQHLSWGTSSENHADKLAHGTTARGERNGHAKLTEVQVREVIARRNAGELRQVIADDFGISPQTVSDIYLGSRWSWLQHHETRRRKSLHELATKDEAR